MKENNGGRSTGQKIGYGDLAFYRFIIDSIPVGVLTVDSELRISSFNHWAEKLTGYRAEEAMGRFCGDVLQGGKCSIQCPLKTIFSLKNPISRLDSTIQNRDGEVIPVRMNTAALLDDQGELLGGVEAFQDISYRKALEREKDNFVSMVAHDMRSSLSIIGGFVLRLLRSDRKTDEDKEEKYLEIVKNEAAKLEMLIDEFLEFSRIQTGRLKLNLSVTSLDKVLMELYEAYQPRAADLGISLDLRSDSGLPLIEADTRQLRRVFANLMDNAIKFSETGGTITISSHRSKEGVVVKVRDDGMGIPPDELPSIFDAFHRGKVGEKIKGFGLGLASVKAIVEAHGGRVRVESEQGKESIFEVLLPKNSVNEG